MAIQTKTTIKTDFETGDTMTQSGFTNLVDSFTGLGETTLQSMQGPLYTTELVSPVCSATNVNSTTINTSTLNATSVSAASANITSVIASSANIVNSDLTLARIATATCTNINIANRLTFTTLQASAAGTTQGSAASLTASVNFLSGITDGVNTAFVIQGGFPGRVQYAINKTAVSANIFPPTGGTIDNGSANAAKGIAANSKMAIFCESSAAFFTWQGV
jgi:hypothetical protein